MHVSDAVEQLLYDRGLSAVEATARWLVDIKQLVSLCDVLTDPAMPRVTAVIHLRQLRR